MRRALAAALLFAGCEGGPGEVCYKNRTCDDGLIVVEYKFAAHTGVSCECVAPSVLVLRVNRRGIGSPDGGLTP